MDRQFKSVLLNLARPAILLCLALFLLLLVGLIFPAALGDLRNIDSEFRLPDYQLFPSFPRFREWFLVLLGDIRIRYLVFLWSADLILFLVLPFFLMLTLIYFSFQLFNRVFLYPMILFLAFSVMFLNILENGLIHLFLFNEALPSGMIFWIFSAIISIKYLLLLCQVFWFLVLSLILCRKHLHFFTLLKTSLKNKNSDEVDL